MKDEELNARWKYDPDYCAELGDCSRVTCPGCGNNDYFHIGDPYSSRRGFQCNICELVEVTTNESGLPLGAL